MLEEKYGINDIFGGCSIVVSFCSSIKLIISGLEIEIKDERLNNIMVIWNLILYMKNSAFIEHGL